VLIDTHCHINMMVKKEFDRELTHNECALAEAIINEATNNDVTTIINVGTSVPESLNCITLAQQYEKIYASIGIHPNDCTPSWRDNFTLIAQLCANKEKNKIVAIGETGLDRHYPGYDIERQRDAFKAHIELSLKHNLALIIHTRDAAEETLHILEEYSKDGLRGVIHCFSEDRLFAQIVIPWGFYIGLGGAITYPKNNELRLVAETIDLENIILETDAPFLPPQKFRGTQNHPLHIKTIAQFIADLRSESYEEIAQQTTINAQNLFFNTLQ
jgi:TatD DNase family protein